MLQRLSIAAQLHFLLLLLLLLVSLLLRSLRLPVASTAASTRTAYGVVLQP